MRVLLGVFLLLSFMSFWYIVRQDSYDKQYIGYAAELRVLSERLARHAGEAVQKAKANAFTYLRYRRNEFTGVLEILKRGKQDSSGNITLPPSPKSIQDKELAVMTRIWNTQKANVDIILDNQELILNLHNTVNTLAGDAQKLQEYYLDIVKVLSNRRDISGRELGDITTQIFNTQEIEENIRTILNIDIEKTDIERLFSKKLTDAESKLKEFKQRYNNDAVYSKLIEIEKLFIVLKERSQEILSIGQTLRKVNDAYLAIYEMIPTFLEETANLERAYSNLSGTRWVNTTTGILLSIITVILLAALLFLMYQDNKYTLKKERDANKALNQEIERLVMDLKDLANGNLTVQASGESKVTASIAEAINYALNALRKLVKGINQTSHKVSSSAVQVKRFTNELVKAMTNQEQEILNTTTSVNSMASFIDQVSQNARKSAAVAESSLQMAHDGVTVVQNTIGGMDRIREQIRETEKRIRRLGESSQEIGEIVSLIDGISEQTNILSLNAAIQAAMAGDAGMGFAVVADEVQQLAVKSSQAAKEVETIVKAIRGDTARASESMERAISEVNTGSQLAHDAGLALGKIESVSKTLAEHIQGISAAAEEQARMSSKITRMMEIIEAIAKETASGTENTADSIENLEALVKELNHSVAEFKLPDESYA